MNLISLMALTSVLLGAPAKADGHGGPHGGKPPELTAAQQSCLSGLGISKPTDEQKSCVDSAMQSLHSSISAGSTPPTADQIAAIESKIDAIHTGCGLPSKATMDSAFSQCGVSLPKGPHGPPPSQQ